MIQISINDQKICEWLTELSASSGRTIDTLVIAALKQSMLSYQKAQGVSTKIIGSYPQKLIDFFSDCYLEKFRMPPGEMPSEYAVNMVFQRITKEVGNEQTAYELLSKAICWYIFMHKSEDAKGTKYPWQMRIFLEQSWLFRQCVEFSGPYTIEMIKQAGVMADPAAAAKLLKRGDLNTGFSTVSITEEKRKVIKLAYKVQEEKGLSDDFLDLPELCGLYSAKLPTLDYIRKAEKFLNEQYI